jgi:hypothetical protein
MSDEKSRGPGSKFRAFGSRKRVPLPGTCLFVALGAGRVGATEHTEYKETKVFGGLGTVRP